MNKKALLLVTIMVCAASLQAVFDNNDKKDVKEADAAREKHLKELSHADHSKHVDYEKAVKPQLAIKVLFEANLRNEKCEKMVFLFHPSLSPDPIKDLDNQKYHLAGIEVWNSLMSGDVGLKKVDPSAFDNRAALYNATIRAGRVSRNILWELCSNPKSVGVEVDDIRFAIEKSDKFLEHIEKAGEDFFAHERLSTILLDKKNWVIFSAGAVVGAVAVGASRVFK